MVLLYLIDADTTRQHQMASSLSHLARAGQEIWRNEIKKILMFVILGVRGGNPILEGDRELLHYLPLFFGPFWSSCVLFSSQVRSHWPFFCMWNRFVSHISFLRSFELKLGNVCSKVSQNATFDLILHVLFLYPVIANLGLVCSLFTPQPLRLEGYCWCLGGQVATGTLWTR